VVEADQIRRADIDALRSEGLSDEEILDVALAAAARTFFSKIMDAVGAEPEERYTSDEAPPDRGE
jgi:hypothetical protein